MILLPSPRYAGARPPFEMLFGNDLERVNAEKRGLRSNVPVLSGSGVQTSDLAADNSVGVRRSD
jgi:hypothetical protein